MNYSIIFSISYISISTLLIIYVANYLFKNGKVFLEQAFKGNTTISDAINNLLKMGFYLINIGYALITIQQRGSISSSNDLIESLAIKIGTIVLILGVMHFFNMYILYLVGKIVKERQQIKEQPKDSNIL